MNLKDKTLMITGGTGSLGQMLTKTIYKNHPDIGKLIIFSRDEQKQFNMGHKFSEQNYPSIRYFIGDVRDYDRLAYAMEGVDYIIHAAAMKHVPVSEYNPMECIKTNVIGAQNVIDAALKTGVQRVVALSTDKACAPTNLYGASKLTSDKLFVSSNNITGDKNIKFSVVRYGNVAGSNGSVIPFFLEKRKDGYLPITHPEMTRFNISLDEAVKMIFFALNSAWGGEIYVPKIPSFKVVDLANAIAPDIEHRIIGIRSGEKIHEQMITESDSYNTYDIGKYYTILPTIQKWSVDEYIDYFKAKKVKENFNYSSGNNDEWLSISDIRALIKNKVDSNFSY